MDFAAFVKILGEHFAGDPLGIDLIRLLEAVRAKHEELQAAAPPPAQPADPPPASFSQHYGGL